MSKHNALNMFGRSGNPAMNDATFSNFTPDSIAPGQTMTCLLYTSDAADE